MSRINRTSLYMGTVQLNAMRSQCRRGKVGCVIVRDKRIIVSGYNNPPGSVDCQHCDITTTCTQAIHAEANAIAFAAKHGIALAGTTLYCHASPCKKCAELIVQSGITKVIFAEYYRKTEGLELLNNNHVLWEKIDEGEIQVNISSEEGKQG